MSKKKKGRKHHIRFNSQSKFSQLDVVISLIRFNSQSQVLPIGRGYFLGAHKGHRCASWRGVKMSASVNTDDNKKTAKRKPFSSVL